MVSTLYIAKPYEHILVLYRTYYYYFGCIDGAGAFNSVPMIRHAPIHERRGHMLALMRSGTTQIQRQSVSILHIHRTRN